MAFAAITGGFTAQSTTSNQSSITMTPDKTYNVGEFLVICLALDNDGTGNNPISSISDNAAGSTNVYTVDTHAVVQQTSAQGGSHGVVISCQLTTQITTSTTITINLTSNTSRDATAALAKGFTVAANSTVEKEVSGSAGVISGDPSGTSLSSLSNIEHLFIGAYACETNSSTALTPSTNYTNITGTQTASGGAAANQAIRAEYRIVTSTSTNTNPTYVSCDNMSMLVSYKEVAGANSYTMTASQASFSVSMQPATFDRGMPAAQASYSVAMQNATLTKGKVMTASQATFNLTGQNALLTRPIRMLAAPVSNLTINTYATGLYFNRVLVAEAKFGAGDDNVILLTMSDANLIRSRIMTATSRTFNVSMQSANFPRTYKLAAVQQTYTVSMQNAMFQRGVTMPTDTYQMFCDFGSYEALFLYNQRLTANQVTFNVTGNATNLFHNYVLPVETHQMEIDTTYDVVFSRGRNMVATKQDYSLTMNPAGLLKGSKLIAVQASFAIAMQSANLRRGYSMSTDTYQMFCDFTSYEALLRWNQLLSATSASFTIAGQNATLSKTSAYVLSATMQTYNVSMQSANLLQGYVMPTDTYQMFCDFGSYEALLYWNQVLSATSRTFNVNGQDVNFSTTSSYIMSAAMQTYAVNMQTANLFWNHVLSATKRDFTVTGNAAILAKGRIMSASQATYTITRYPAILQALRILRASTAHFDLLTFAVSFDAPALPETFRPDLIPLTPTFPIQPLTAGYCGLPKEILSALKRDDLFYLGIEFYVPTEDDIFSNPQRAVFTFSDSRFRWHNRNYQDKIREIPELTKFIGKTFNRLSLDMANVERGNTSGSAFVFKNLIRGFRVAVRLIFPNAPEVENTRLIWWGRVSTVEDISEQGVRINCSQEIGDFSYELARQKYGQACPLWFGKGECLGDQTLEEKSPLYQAAYNTYGQGGCNRTEQRCIQLGNRRLFQGQNTVTVSGQFIREEVVKKKFLWFFSYKKKNRIPVQWSSKNQSGNSDVAIPLIYGRARVDLHSFLWADIGTQIIALSGACKGKIDSFYNITSENPALTIASVTQHLGELGGIGTQQPDGRFIQSGENSRLAYLGITYNGSPPADEPEEVPSTSAVVKGLIIPVKNNFGEFVEEWTNNPVWIVRHMLVNFPYTVVKPSWFNEAKLLETAKYCFTVIEDDTNSEIAVISASSHADYEAGEFRRFRSTNRVDAYTINENNRLSLTGQTELLSSGKQQNPDMELLEDDVPIGSEPDVWWASAIGNSLLGQNRTYLALRYTANLVLNDTAKLSDILFSLLFPTFRGFMRFNHFGTIDIDCRKPADNTFLRADTPLADTEIPVADAVKFSTTCGYLLIGVGKKTAEIAKINGIRFVNAFAQTTVEGTTSGSLGFEVTEAFIDRDSAPAELYLDFSGMGSAGEKISLKFTTPVQDETAQNELLWDYYVDDAADSVETIALLFKTRLMASPSFREHWSADIFPERPTRIIVRCKTGYVQLDRPLLNTHLQGEEVLRVVEVYEDGKDEENPHGIKDNMSNFRIGVRKQDTYHGVKSTYISAVQDFRETEIQPRVAWDAAEQERNLNLLELDLRGVDNYRQAAFLNKSATIEFVDGNLYATWRTGIKAMFHEEGEVVAVRHQTMEGISYTPFTIEDIRYDHSNMEVSLLGKLYLSAAFDERVAKEEKFLEASLVPNENYQTVPPPTLRQGGYSSTGTGDGGGDIRQNIRYETYPYETFPSQQVYSPEGRDKL